jgi:hypothetical protein
MNMMMIFGWVFTQLEPFFLDAQITTTSLETNITQSTITIRIYLSRTYRRAFYYQSSL